jgi:hypothetical protein
MHTYSGASNLALLTAAQVLKELPKVIGRSSEGNNNNNNNNNRSSNNGSSNAPPPVSLVERGGVVVEGALRRLEAESGGGVTVHGQGLMWGAVFRGKGGGGGRGNPSTASSNSSSSDSGRDYHQQQQQQQHSQLSQHSSSSSSSEIEEEQEAVRLFVKHCDDRNVAAYPIPRAGGFILTPPLDVADDDHHHHGACADTTGNGNTGNGVGEATAVLEEAMERIVDAALATVKELRR